MAGCVAALTLVASGCGQSMSGSGSGVSSGGGGTSGEGGTLSTASTSLGTGSTSLGTVVTDSSGRTLYYFSLDTTSSTSCVSANCVATWPPLIGSPIIPSGVNLYVSNMGALHRPDGRLQASYLTHPLYRYSGDTGPDQTNGNCVSDNGGTWHAALAYANPVGGGTRCGGSSNYGGY